MPFEIGCVAVLVFWPPVAPSARSAIALGVDCTTEKTSVSESTCRSAWNRLSENSSQTFSEARLPGIRKSLTSEMVQFHLTISAVCSIDKASGLDNYLKRYVQRHNALGSTKRTHIFILEIWLTSSALLCFHRQIPMRRWPECDFLLQQMNNQRRHRTRIVQTGLEFVDTSKRRRISELRIFESRVSLFSSEWTPKQMTTDTDVAQARQWWSYLRHHG